MESTKSTGQLHVLPGVFWGGTDDSQDGLSSACEQQEEKTKHPRPGQLKLNDGWKQKKDLLTSDHSFRGGRKYR